MEGYETILKDNDNLIKFFKSRQEIELTYSTALNDLYLRSQEMERRQEDTKRPLATTIPTWKKAWIEIRSLTKQQSLIHKVHVEQLEKTLVELTQSKIINERVKRRVKDDGIKSSNEYTDYLAVVGRLKKSYETKVSELQNEKETEREEEGSDSGHDRRNSSSSSKGEWERVSSPTPPSTLISGVTSTSTSSTSAAASYLDPPKANFMDTINSISKKDWSGEKHRVNSMIRAVGNVGKFAENAITGSGTSPSKTRSKNKDGRAKREAEQADRDYRAAIFRLATLKLQKERIRKAAREGTRECASEMSSMLKGIFNQHRLDLESLGTSLISIAQHAKVLVDLINPANDSIDFMNALPPPPPPDEPVYYFNAFVGESKNLLFGFSLTDVLGMANSNQLVPLVVSRCIEEIDSHGLDFEGIYRISGKLSITQKLVQRMEKDEENFKFDPLDDPATVAGVLKLYLRALPFPLFPFSTAERVAFSATYDSDPALHMASLSRRIFRLPPVHQATLKALLEHLSRVVEHENMNKMGVLQLGIVFSAVIFGEDNGATLDSMMKPSKDIVMQLLIQNHSTIFGNRALQQSTSRIRADSLSLPQIVTTSIPIPESSSSNSTDNLTVVEPTVHDVSPIDSLYELYRDSIDATSSSLDETSISAPLPIIQVDPSPDSS